MSEKGKTEQKRTQNNENKKKNKETNKSPPACLQRKAQVWSLFQNAP